MTQTNALERMNNVDLSRYGKRIVQALWDPEPKNDCSAPIWCLGVRYESSPHEDDSQQAATREGIGESQATSGSETIPPLSRGFSNYHEIDAKEARDARAATAPAGSWPQAFLDDFDARIWITYRSSFPAIPTSDHPRASVGMSLPMRIKSQIKGPNGFTSDTGWGCMIRSGQCIVANAMAILRLGRGWRRGTYVSEEKQLLALFADDPRASFSIHRFVEHGAAACGTFPGQWFGPSATAKCIEALALTFSAHSSGFRVYVTGDGPDVYQETLMKIARPNGLSFQPTLLLVGTRLGIDRVTPVYWDALRDALCMPQSVGIAGGRPASSHYFVGTQDKTLIYLDPHHTRPALPYHENASDYTREEVDTCHTRRLRRIPLDEVDPSMLFAFLIQSEADWKDWRSRVSNSPGKAIFHIADSEPQLNEAGIERESAIEEVQAFDDDDVESDGDRPHNF